MISFGNKKKSPGAAVTKLIKDRRAAYSSAVLITSGKACYLSKVLLGNSLRNEKWNQKTQKTNTQQPVLLFPLLRNICICSFKNKQFERSDRKRLGDASLCFLLHTD